MPKSCDLDTIKINDTSFNVTSEAKDLEAVPEAIKRLYDNLVESLDSAAGGALDQRAGLDGLFSPDIRINFRSTKKGQIIEKITIQGEPTPVYGPETEKLIRPLNRERTANYLYNINKMMLTPLIGGTPECNVSTGIAGSAYILRYTKGLTIRDAKDTPYQPIHQWADETFIEPIEEIAQDIKVTSKNKGKYDWFFQGTNYSSAAALPIISETCTVEEIKDKFLNTFDLQAILCDVVACLRLPSVGIKAPSFYLPPGIGMPSFSLPDMRELSKKLADLLSQILAKLLCVYVNGILDILSTPFCDTAIEEQLAANELNTDFDIPRRAMVEALIDLEIPTDSDTIEQIKDLIDSLVSFLTPSELCALLAGEPPSQEVLSIISRLAQVSGTSAQEALNTPESIKVFFENLGLFVDEEFCSNLGDFDELLGTYTCSDTAELLQLVRQSLEDENLPESEIENALERSRAELFDRAKALELLSDPDSFRSFFPSSTFPASLNSAITELPRSVQVSATAMAKSILSPSKMSYMSSLRNFGTALFLESSAPADVNDPGYDFDARLKIEESTQRLKNYILRTEEVGSIALSEMPLSTLRDILLILCEQFQKETIPLFENGELVEENFVHQKVYKLIQVGPDEYRAELGPYPYISQEEIRQRIYSSTDEINPTEVEVSLKNITGVIDNDPLARYMDDLIFPIQLSEVVQIGNDDEKRQLIKISNREDLIETTSNPTSIERPVLKISIIDKINERLLDISQVVQSNIEKGTQVTQKSDLLFLLRDVYNRNDEIQREDTSQELITANVGPEDIYTIEISDPFSSDDNTRRFVKFQEEPSSKGLDKYSIEVNDLNNLGEKTKFRYCDEIPQVFLEVSTEEQTASRSEEFFFYLENSIKRVLKSTQILNDSEAGSLATSLSEAAKFEDESKTYANILEGTLEEIFFIFKNSNMFNEK